MLPSSRVRTVTASAAATDEEIKLLAQSDIRSALANRSRYEPLLIAALCAGDAAGQVPAARDHEGHRSQIQRDSAPSTNSAQGFRVEGHEVLIAARLVGSSLVDEHALLGRNDVAALQAVVAQEAFGRGDVRDLRERACRAPDARAARARLLSARRRASSMRCRHSSRETSGSLGGKIVAERGAQVRSEPNTRADRQDTWQVRWRRRPRSP